MIPNWHRFQHYRNRRPTWIKVYLDLAHKEEFLNLTGHQRAVLLGLWMEYCESGGKLPLTLGSLSAHLRLRVMSRDIEALNDAGFIEVSASKPLAKRLQREVLRTSKSGDDAAPVERGGASSPQKQLSAAARKYVHDWKGGSSDAFDEGLDELERLYRTRLQAGERYRLWEQAWHQGQQLQAH